MNTGFCKITKHVDVGGRKFHPGEVLEATPELFKQLVRLSAAVPVGEKGRSLTSGPVVSDITPTVRRAA